MRRRRRERPFDWTRFARKAALGGAWLVLSFVGHLAIITLIWELRLALLPWPVETEPYRPPRIADLDPKQPPLPDMIVLPPPEPPPPEEIPPPDDVELEKPDPPPEVFEALPRTYEFDALPPAAEPDRPWTGPGRYAALSVGWRDNRRWERRAAARWPEGEQALRLALAWLAAHQDDDGKWDSDDFAKHDPFGDRCGGPGDQLYDVGQSGLALLALLGAGHTDSATSPPGNPYAHGVRRGIRFLIKQQDSDGHFGRRASMKHMYMHAIATTALCDAYMTTGNPRYKRPAQRGLDFVARARNPYMAWRYDVRGGENDSSLTGWCVTALRLGRLARLAVDPDAFEGARGWFDKMTDPNFGQVGYNYTGGSPRRDSKMHGDRYPVELSQSMTAFGIWARICMGEDPRESALIRKGVKLCLETPPRWDRDSGSIDMYYWYCGAMALHQVGGTEWQDWSKRLRAAVLAGQRPAGSGSVSGSWDPIGVWGEDGGRVYATAMMAMCLEADYRFERVFRAR